ncbi:MAG: transcriptional repressor [Oscillospiraceae bacterium]|nr:transcriptional repressor [Oscillospiraceae bacterium]
METTRKHSFKRDEILRVLRSTKRHPDAAWVYEQLRPVIPDLSLGTVYRNLALFKREGEILSVGVFDGIEHFDADTSPHAHFVCRRCGAILDLPALTDGALDAEASRLTGGTAQRHEIVFYGLCADCKDS